MAFCDIFWWKHTSRLDTHTYIDIIDMYYIYIINTCNQNDLRQYCSDNINSEVSIRNSTQALSISSFEEWKKKPHDDGYYNSMCVFGPQIYYDVHAEMCVYLRIKSINIQMYKYVTICLFILYYWLSWNYILVVSYIH